MAVYEHLYHPYEGRLTPERLRFLVIPRHAIREIFRSKITTGFFVLCLVYPLVAAIIIYLHHNANAMSILEIDLDDIIPINATFFRAFLETQSFLGLVLAVLVGPSLIASDLANNAIPLYLSRPFSRFEYVLGKFVVLAALFSAITWVPGTILLLLQGYLEGAGWLAANSNIAAGVILGGMAWVLLLGLLALSISALVKWGLAARALLFAIFIIPSAVSAVVNEIFDTKIGNVINLTQVLHAIWTSLFGLQDSSGLGFGLGLTVLTIVCGLCAVILARRVRAYEVVG
jgi:ABC-2 type transport system permease protein